MSTFLNVLVAPTRGDLTQFTAVLSTPRCTGREPATQSVAGSLLCLVTSIESEAGTLSNI